MEERQRKALVSSLALSFLLSLAATLQAASPPVPTLKWRKGGYSVVQFNKGMNSSPAILDVNGDGVKDIVWANYKVFAFDGKTGSAFWEFWAGTDRSNPDLYQSIGTFCSVVVADINGDAQPEIVTAHADGTVSAYSAAGYFLPGFPTQPAGRTDPIYSLSVYDLDRNGDLEIIIGWGYKNNLNCCVIEHNGQVRTGFPQYVPNEYANALGVYNANIAVGDINRDGWGEIVVPSDTGKTCIYYPDGSPFPVNSIFGSKNKWPLVVNYESYNTEIAGYSATGPFYMGTDHPATIADLDVDGDYEIVLPAAVFSNPPDHNYQNLYISPFLYQTDRTRFNNGSYDWEGSLPQTGAPLSNDYQVIPIKTTNPVVVDLDHDGDKEILTAAYDGKLHCYWLDKTEHGQWPFSVYDAAEGVIRFASEPAVADLNNDGSLEVIFASWPQYYSGTGGHLYILDGSGQLLHKVALPYGDNGDVGERNFDGGLACPTIADVDGDGEYEILIGTVYAGLCVYDLPGAPKGFAPWPTGRHDLARTGCADYSLAQDDLIVTRSGDGVYFRDSATGSWVRLASPANQIAAGDLDGDGVDDLIGLWPTQGGVWVQYSRDDRWVKLSSLADEVGTGDMNGDGREDLVGTWLSQGVYYRDSQSGTWVKMATPAEHIAAADLDGDGIQDLLGDWPAQGGVWVKLSSSLGWAKLASSVEDLEAGDMNGDGREDLLGTWLSQGVYYRDSQSGAWVKIASYATQIASGDLDGEGRDDLLGLWPAQGGVWVKHLFSGRWENPSPTVLGIAGGKMRKDVIGGGLMAPLLQADSRFPERKDVGEAPWIDLSDYGPGGKGFRYVEQKNIPVGSQLDGRLDKGFKEEPGQRRTGYGEGSLSAPSRQRKPARHLP